MAFQNFLVFQRQGYRDIETPLAFANQSKQLMRSAPLGAKGCQQDVRVEHGLVDQNVPVTSVRLSLPAAVVHRATLEPSHPELVIP